MPEGFYPLESIFLLLALMALARIPFLIRLSRQQKETSSCRSMKSFLVVAIFRT